MILQSFELLLQVDKRIIIGSDHGGFDIKENLILWLKNHSFEPTDGGCYDSNSVNYPEIGFQVVKRVASGEFSRGVLVCGTGIGMSITANRISTIRAALCHNAEYAKLSREHNDSNILVLGGRFLKNGESEQILETWLHTDYAGGRHQTRIEMMDDPAFL